MLIDALLHPAILGEADDPPSSPDEGECWLVGGTPGGEWIDRPGMLACFSGGGWIYALPRDGMRLLDLSNGQLMLFRDGWTKATAPSPPTGGTTIDTEARDAIVDLIAALADSGILPPG